MRKRRMKSVKEELLKKAREAMLAAVQIYNNPQITFKTESFITLSVIAWTYLFHAYYRMNNVDYRYFEKKGTRKFYSKTKYGAYKHWELERCLNDKASPLDNETSNNLKFLIGIRHEVEHQMTDQIDEYLSAKLQACAINFDFYISKYFGEKYSLNNDLALAIQFSPLTPTQQNMLHNNEHMLSNVRNYIVEFEDKLSDETLKSSRYAYRVLFVPINAKRKGQADQVVEFIKSDSPLAEGLEKSYAVIKETEKRKYRPKEIADKMVAEGYTAFTINKHTECWKSYDAKNPKYSFGVEVSGTWYWYDNWLDEVRKYCEKNRDILIK